MLSKLFKRKELAKEIFNPVTGDVIDIESVADPVFSSKVMGEGFAIEPQKEEVFAPICGTISSIFPTKHAIGLIDTDGNEVLVHMGIDTVELKGNGFLVLVKEGQEVTQDTLLAKMDLDFIKESGKLTSVMIIFTNLEDKKINIDLGKRQSRIAIGKIR